MSHAASGNSSHRLTPGRAGVVDQDVQLVLALAHLGGQPPALLLAGEVGGDGDDLPVRRQLGDGGVAGLGLAGADVDARAGLQQAARHHQADAAGAAGDDGDLAGEVEQVHGYLRVRPLSGFTTLSRGRGAREATGCVSLCP